MPKKLGEAFQTTLQGAFPLSTSPLVQCITNEITCESMANALLYIDAKPVMADDPREFAEFFQQNDALLLNLGHISPEREKSLLTAGKYAAEADKGTVVDLVGVSATQLRYELAHQLLAYQPNVVKGNHSELRRFCDLKSAGRGVDGSPLDQSASALTELTEALKKLAQKFPRTTFLATGAIDLVVDHQGAWQLENGVPQLDRFTGTGDLVGAVIAALLGTGLTATEAVIAGVSYFNRCGEQAAQLATSGGLADFRQETLNQLSLLMKNSTWYQAVKGSQR